MSLIDLFKMNYSFLLNKRLKNSLTATLRLFQIFLSKGWLALLSHSAATLHLYYLQRPRLSSKVILYNDQTEMKKCVHNLVAYTNDVSDLYCQTH